MLRNPITLTVPHMLLTAATVLTVSMLVTLPSAGRAQVPEQPSGAQAELAQAIRPGPQAPLSERLPVLDADGNEVFVEIRVEPGAGYLEREWIMLVNADQQQLMIRQAPALMQFLEETRVFEATNSFLLRFRVPPDLDALDIVLQLIPSSLHGLIDRNHIYSAQSEADSRSSSGQNSGQPPQASVLPMPMTSVCNRQLSIGMIDSAVNAQHPAFVPGGRSMPLVTRGFIDQNLVEPNGHGTAVAGVLIGHTQGLQPLLPNATLYSASVVYAQDIYSQGTTALYLMQALDWLLSVEELQVINISMTGPPNRVLEQGVATAQRQGRILVAAVGNDGPFAPPLYPAAYEGVIGVTAVTVDRAIYRWANQGPQLDFAALGVSVVTARGDGTVGAESGTSMASPVVAAFVACELAADPLADIPRALERLKARAEDLGAPGHDPVFGHGLLHPRLP